MKYALMTFAAAGSMAFSPAISTAFANDLMPAEQQNALIQKYCAVCHTDAARNGGLSLQHFDAAEAAPSLAAMLVSKLNGGAMGAAGIKAPDKATEAALFNALTARSVGANKWNVNRAQDPATKAPMLTASVLRELPSSRNASVRSMYRLVLACNAATREGEIQLAWSPSPKTGTLSALVDGKTAHTYNVEGQEKMGNGSALTTGPAAVNLYDARQATQSTRMRLPAKSLLISNLFPDESVAFSFDDLPRAARQSLALCFD